MWALLVKRMAPSPIDTWPLITRAQRCMLLGCKELSTPIAGDLGSRIAGPFVHRALNTSHNHDTMFIIDAKGDLKINGQPWEHAMIQAEGRVVLKHPSSMLADPNQKNPRPMMVDRSQRQAGYMYSK